MSIASVLEALRAEYRPALEEEVQTLAAAVAAEDWPAVRRIAHRIAGTAGSYGFKDASVSARTIEDALDEGHNDLVPAAFAALKATL